MKMAQPMPNMTSKSKNLEETELPLQQPQKLEPLSASLQPATTPNAAVMQPYLISLCDILGRIGANQMYNNDIYVSCIKEMVYPHHGVFTPIRQEYLDLLEQAPLPPPTTTTSLLSTKDKLLVAMDIGVGTGVLTAWLLQQYAMANQATATTMRGERQWQFSTVIGTNNNPAAIACAQENLQHMGLSVTISMTTSATQ